MYGQLSLRWILLGPSHLESNEESKERQRPIRRMLTIYTNHKAHPFSGENLVQKHKLTTFNVAGE